jgi:hypothetical protein
VQAPLVDAGQDVKGLLPVGARFTGVVLSFSEISYPPVGDIQVALPLGVTGIARRQFLGNRQAVAIGLCGVVARRASFAWLTDLERVRDEPGSAERITTRLVRGLQETQPRYLPYEVAAVVALRSPET